MISASLTALARLLAVGLPLIAFAASAQTLPKPQGPEILVVSGTIANTNGAGGAAYDLAMLERLGVKKLATTTAWTDGKPTFEGVLMSDLLKAVAASGQAQKVTAVALNDYKVEIPLSDFTKYPVLLAFKMNGEELRTRDKGPLWIIYPQDDFPELKNKETQSKWVWQIKELRIQ